MSSQSHLCGTRGRWINRWYHSGKLTHWGRVTHICVSDLTIIGSDNGLSPGRRQAIIRTNARILLKRPLRTNLRNSIIFIHDNAFESVVCEKAAILSRPQYLKHTIISHNWSRYRPAGIDRYRSGAGILWHVYRTGVLAFLKTLRRNLSDLDEDTWRSSYGWVDEDISRKWKQNMTQPLYDQESNYLPLGNTHIQCTCC